MFPNHLHFQKCHSEVLRVLAFSHDPLTLGCPWRNRLLLMWRSSCFNLNSHLNSSPFLKGWVRPPSSTGSFQLLGQNAKRPICFKYWFQVSSRWIQLSTQQQTVAETLIQQTNPKVVCLSPVLFYHHKILRVFSHQNTWFDWGPRCHLLHRHRHILLSFNCTFEDVQLTLIRS